VSILAEEAAHWKDLAPFNDEGVARAVFHSRIPVNFRRSVMNRLSIAVFCGGSPGADATAAAELVVTRQEELAGTLESCI